MPSISEVAALVVGDFGLSDSTRDIIIAKNTGGLLRIYELHLQEENQQRQCSKERRLTESTTLLVAEKFLHQYLVDSYTSIEDQRLAYIRFHQDEMCADLYNNIVDAVNKGDTEAKSVGKGIVLPTTFTGSPRYMM
ncbi:hypothetical protein V2J09_011058 [Rumex salicifolius]